MTSGEYIKKLRLQKGMTLDEVGRLVGVGKSTVRKWETGAIANMRKDKIQKLADALGVSPMDIINLEMPSKIEKQPKPKPELSDDEELLIQLFRTVPVEDRQLVLQMIRAALASKGLL